MRIARLLVSWHRYKTIRVKWSTFLWNPFAVTSGVRLRCNQWSGVRCGSRQFFGDANDILPGFLRICQKKIYAANFPHQIFCNSWLLSSHKLSNMKLMTDFLLFESDFFFGVRLIHSTANKCDFINIVKRCRNFCAQFFWDFTRICDR